MMCQTMFILDINRTISWAKRLEFCIAAGCCSSISIIKQPQWRPGWFVPVELNKTESINKLYWIKTKIIMAST